MTPPEHRSFLWRAIEVRRKELKLTAEQVVAMRTRRKIRDGQSVEDDTYAKIDLKMRWEPGSAKAAAEDEIEPKVLARPVADVTSVLRTLSDASVVALQLPSDAIPKADALVRQLFDALQGLDDENR